MDGLAACKRPECQRRQLRALRNLALADTVDVIVNYVVSKDRKTSVEAVKVDLLDCFHF